MKCELIVEMSASPTHPKVVSGEWAKGYIQPIGTVTEHPQAFRLVQNGCAISADDECKARVDRTSEQLALAKKHYPAIALGIIPEDREAFFAGEMKGYNPDGSWIPGPNFTVEDLEDEDDDTEEQDDE